MRPSKISVKSIRVPEPISPSTQVSKLAAGRHPAGYSFSSQSLSFLGRQQGDTLRAIVPLLSLRVSVSSHASTSRPEFLKPAAGRHPAGYVLVSWLQCKTIGYDLVSVSVSVFVFDNDILQVYRDKNLRSNLDLRTPSLSSLYLNLNLYNPEPVESIP